MTYETKRKLQSIFEKIGIYSLAKYIYRIHYYLRHKKIQKGSKKRKSGWVDEKYESMIKYKNTHKGEKCFIVATGPSLTLEDINLLKNQYVFSMNSIIKLFDKTDWRPTYYAIQDSKVYEKLYKDEYFDGLKEIFAADFLSEEHTLPVDTHIFPLDLLDHMYYKRKTPFDTKFSDDAYAVVYDGGSITFSIMQIAVYMGFSKIYLLGCDCDYSGEKKHFSDYGYTSHNNPEHNMLVSYAKAKEYADTHNVEILNATRGGKLEIFKRISLEEAIKD